MEKRKTKIDLIKRVKSHRKEKRTFGLRALKKKNVPDLNTRSVGSLVSQMAAVGMQLDAKKTKNVSLNARVTLFFNFIWCYKTKHQGKCFGFFSWKRSVDALVPVYNNNKKKILLTEGAFKTN